MEIEISWRDLQPIDLDALEWSGGPSHLQAVREALERVWQDEAELVVAELPNGRLVALGGLDLAKQEGVGWLWMLSVHEAWQSLGLGSALVGELEHRAAARGLDTVSLSVEHDNPRAAALYRRLGYRGVGQLLETWPVGEHQTWVTSCLAMTRTL